jgi:hypothetical protein
MTLKKEEKPRYTAPVPAVLTSEGLLIGHDSWYAPENLETARDLSWRYMENFEANVQIREKYLRKIEEETLPHKAEMVRIADELRRLQVPVRTRQRCFGINHENDPGFDFGRCDLCPAGAECYDVQAEEMRRREG